MHIYKTTVPGMNELSGVGNAPTDKQYEFALAQPDALKGCKMLIASLTADQLEGTKFLLKQGFIEIGKPKRNPNTQHLINLLVKYIR